MFEYTVTMDLHNGQTTMTFVQARNEYDAFLMALGNEDLAWTDVEYHTVALGW